VVIARSLRSARRFPESRSVIARMHYLTLPVGTIILPKNPLNSATAANDASVPVRTQAMDPSRHIKGRTDLNETTYTVALPRSSDGHVDAGQAAGTLGKLLPAAVRRGDGTRRCPRAVRSRKSTTRAFAMASGGRPSSTAFLACRSIEPITAGS
jgi:hypothetical protein